MIKSLISKIRFRKKMKVSKPIKFSSKNSDIRIKEAASYVGKNFSRAIVKLSER